MLTIPKPFPCLIGRFDVAKKNESAKVETLEKLKALGVPDAEAEEVHDELEKANLGLVDLLKWGPKLVKVLPLIRELVKELFGKELPDLPGLAPKK